MIGTLITMVGGPTVYILRKHATLLNRLEEAYDHKIEDEQVWRPKVTENIKAIAVVNSKLDALIKGQDEMQKNQMDLIKMLNRRSQFRSQAESDFSG